MADVALVPRRLLLAAAAALPTSALARPAHHAPAHHPAAKRPVEHPAKPRAANLPLVVLDAGHGGKDPGAIGVSGTYEKHIAFAAAEELRRQLLAAGSCRVALTRKRDVLPAASRPGRNRPGARRRPVRLHARRRPARPHRPRRQRLHPGRPGLRRADGSARPAREQRRPLRRSQIPQRPPGRGRYPRQPGPRGNPPGLRPHGPPRSSMRCSPRWGCSPTRPGTRTSWCCARPIFRAYWSKWASCPTIRTKQRCAGPNTGPGSPPRCGRPSRPSLIRAAQRRMSRPVRGREHHVDPGPEQG